MFTDVLTKRILVVDDDPMTREALHRALTQAGYDVSIACDAEEAIRAFEAAGDVQAVISDVHLPGTDGKSMIDHLRTRRPELKAVLLTAYGSVVEYLEATKSGAVEYLLKPIDLPHLMFILEQSIGRPVEMPSDYWVN